MTELKRDKELQEIAKLFDESDNLIAEIKTSFKYWTDVVKKGG